MPQALPIDCVVLSQRLLNDSLFIFIDSVSLAIKKEKIKDKDKVKNKDKNKVKDKDNEKEKKKDKERKK